MFVWRTIWRSDIDLCWFQIIGNLDDQICLVDLHKSTHKWVSITKKTKEKQKKTSTFLIFTEVTIPYNTTHAYPRYRAIPSNTRNKRSQALLSYLQRWLYHPRHPFCSPREHIPNLMSTSWYQKNISVSMSFSVPNKHNIIVHWTNSSLVGLEDAGAMCICAMLRVKKVPYYHQSCKHSDQ